MFKVSPSSKSRSIALVELLNSTSIATPSLLPSLVDTDDSNVGGFVGAFLITVICFSLAKILELFDISCALFIKRVWLSPLLDVPFTDLGIFIFFGSVLLSVQNSMSSMIFMPVTSSPWLKFSVLGPVNISASYPPERSKGVLRVMLSSCPILGSIDSSTAASNSSPKTSPPLDLLIKLIMVIFDIVPSLLIP